MIRRSDALVMIVDDDGDIREAFVGVLTDLGYEVISANEGEQALARLAESGAALPSVIILDLMMPKMDGWEFLVRLRANPTTKSIPVIIASADITAKKLAATAGAVAFLPKPVHLPELLEQLEKYR